MKKLLFLLLFIPLVSFGQTAKEYFYNGNDKAENGDYYGAIADYTNSIEIDPNYAPAYYRRAIAKELSGIDACADARKVKELGYNAFESPAKLMERVCKSSSSYYTYNQEENYRGKNLLTSSENKFDPEDYLNSMARQVFDKIKNDSSKYTLEDGLINISSNPLAQLAKEYFYSGLDKARQNDYSGAIADYTKAIELNPNYATAYYNRSVAKEILGDLNGACDDAKKAINLGSNASIKWVAENCN